MVAKPASLRWPAVSGPLRTRLWAARGLAGHRYAVEHFSPDFFGSCFDRVLSEAAELSASG
jgi:hypothetical protein